MILFLLGPVGRAVLRVLKEKIKAAEEQFRLTRKRLEQDFETDVKALEDRLEKDTDDQLSRAVSTIFTEAK